MDMIISSTTCNTAPSALHHKQDAVRGGAGEGKPPPRQDVALKCPRCHSTNTKFYCYYYNNNMMQPCYFCKACRRYWMQGVTLHNVLPTLTSTGGDFELPIPTGMDMHNQVSLPFVPPSFLDILTGGVHDGNSTYSIDGLSMDLPFSPPSLGVAPMHGQAMGVSTDHTGDGGPARCGGSESEG